MARAMVTQYGMSERIGAIKLGQESGEVFLGRDMGHQRDYSEEVAGVVDEEVASSSRPRTTRPGRSSSRTATSSTTWSLELLEKETLDKEQIAEIFDPDPQAARPSGLDRLGQARRRRPARS